MDVFQSDKPCNQCRIRDSLLSQQNLTAGSAEPVACCAFSLPTPAQFPA
jgi:hypothetical protein